LGHGIKPAFAPTWANPRKAVPVSGHTSAERLNPRPEAPFFHESSAIPSAMAAAQRAARGEQPHEREQQRGSKTEAGPIDRERRGQDEQHRRRGNADGCAGARLERAQPEAARHQRHTEAKRARARKPGCSAH
jgi:hypothetical protein